MQYLTPDYHGKGEGETRSYLNFIGYCGPPTHTQFIQKKRISTASSHSDASVLPCAAGPMSGGGGLVCSILFKLITNTFPPDPRGIWWTGLPHSPLRLFCYSGDTAAAVATRALFSTNSTTSRRNLCIVCVH